MSKVTEQYDEILDELSAIKKHSEKIEELEKKVGALTQKVDAIPTTPPEAPKVIIPSEKLKADVKDGVSNYFDNLPDSSGLFSPQNIQKVGNIFLKAHNIVLQKIRTENDQEEDKRREERNAKYDAQGVRTVEQVAEWAPEFSPVTQRLMRFFGANMFNENEPAETVHRLLKVFGEVLEPVVTPKPPTLKAWLQYKWKQFKARTLKQKLSMTMFLLITWGIPALSLCAYWYQQSVMDLDRTNRIFYYKVMRNEKLSGEYQQLDSLIHNDSFFKTYRTLEH